ncbi:hypothetical protein GE300_02050 [Rhodobacteraceae bacterium 2CG4]|uniref:DUF2029 domain-containing protein n=1 Tax=Halovulum marinum TaxID=2662447 RepID=A0A6L5YVX7_9RHOB|nr:hypothetical protein [Halovulum marinum]MSU88398.1 hypothetical protein [Halovulum marinum]
MTIQSFRFALVLAGVFLALAAISLAPGSLRLTGHEVDTIHSLDIAYRLADGARPHVDFMTPLGMFAFLPVQMFLERGYGPGMAFLLAQTMVGMLLLPGIWWIGISRLGGWVRPLYGIGMVMLAMALIFGGENPALTLSMYYNRWAWVLTSFIVFPMLLPPRDGWRAPLVDGALMGVAGAALVMIKVTFAIALLPAVLVFVLRERQMVLAGAGAITALAVLAAVTVGYGGAGFWQAYAADLLEVSAGRVRPHPGLALGDIVASPRFLPISALLMATVVLWRRAGMEGQGLYLLLLAPGFVYITYQNWGNDPKWLFLLGVVLLAHRPRADAPPIRGFSPRAVATVLGLFAFLLFFPSMSNLATSGMRNLTYDTKEMSPIFPLAGRQDILIAAERKYTGGVEMPFSRVGYPEGEAPEEPVTKSFEIAGETFADCVMTGPVVGWLWKAAAQLAEVPEAVGQQVYVADIHDFLWLFGPFRPTRGAGPWYYGADGDLAEVAFVMVPLCAVSSRARAMKLEDLQASGETLEEVLRTDLFILLRRQQAAG